MRWFRIDPRERARSREAEPWDTARVDRGSRASEELAREVAKALREKLREAGRGEPGRFS